MNCKKCGFVLQNNNGYCPNCGHPIDNNSVKRESKKKIIGIVIIVLVVIISLVIGFMIGKSTNKDVNGSTSALNNNETKNDDEKTNTESEVGKDTTSDSGTEKTYTYKRFDVSKIEKSLEKQDNLSKNIEVNDIFFNNLKADYSRFENVYIYGKNNNAIPVTVLIHIDYYDAEGYRIDRETVDGVIKANSEFVLSSYAKDDSVDYKSIKLTYYATNIKSYYTDIKLSNKDVVATRLSDDTIDITVHNPSTTNEIKIGQVGCLYYKNKKLIFAIAAGVTNISKNGYGKTSCYEHLLNGLGNTDKKLIDYDDYRVIAHSAYDYDSENY